MIALMMTVGLGVAPQMTNLKAWAETLEYPASAAAAIEVGRVQIEMLVDPAGDPVNCAIVDSSGSRSPDVTSCRISMQHARFKPALDEAGQPVFGVSRNAFDYRMAMRNRKLPWSDYTLTVSRLPSEMTRPAVLRIVTDTIGHVESCVVDTSSGAAKLDALACSYERASIVVAPPLDAGGAPVRALRLTTVGFAAAGPN